jgi:hypothetical protein
MRKSRNLFAKQTAPKEPMLFESVPTRIIPEAGRLPELILEQADGKMPRKDLLIRVVRRHTGDFSCSEINKSISQLIKNSRLVSATGKGRINDTIEVWKP